MARGAMYELSCPGEMLRGGDLAVFRRRIASIESVPDPLMESRTTPGSGGDCRSCSDCDCLRVVAKWLRLSDPARRGSVAMRFLCGRGGFS